jgi:hypothetical protein
MRRTIIAIFAFLAFTSAVPVVHADPLGDCVAAIPTLQKIMLPGDRSKVSPDQLAHFDQLNAALMAARKLSNVTVDAWNSEIKKLTCSADLDVDGRAMLQAIHDTDLIPPDQKSLLSGSYVIPLPGNTQIVDPHSRVRYTVQPTSTGSLVTILSNQ